MTVLGLMTVIHAMPFLLSGALRTIEVVVAALLLGVVCGVAGGTAKLSRSRCLRRAAGVYVSVIRGT
ncbi:MAG: ABC transporter permease subunit, partial [Acetobacteraceae bacterium]